MNVSNLKTNYVCPQFHIICDGLFQTIFSLGDNDMVVDAIFNQLFESNEDVYAEDEISVDGELIYSTAP